MNRYKIGAFALSVAIALPIFVSALESIFGTTPIDAAMFRYLGWNMANGGDYNTAWDCKGPVLIFFEAVGYLIAPDSHFGPTWVFCALWCITLVLLYKLARIFLTGNVSAVLTLLFSFVQLGVVGLRAMNCQEILSIFFALCGVHFALRSRWWGIALAGVCTGCVFLIKANLCSFSVGLFAYWVMRSIESRDYRIVVCNGLVALGGFVTTLAGVTLLFYPDGILPMWDGALFYNLFERNLGIDLSWLGWWRNYLLTHVNFHNRDAFFFMAWVLALPVAFHGACAMWKGRREYVIFAIWLLSEVVMAFVSKGFYTHYLMLTLVPMSILIGAAYEHRFKCAAIFAAVILVLSVVYEYPLACYQMYVANRLYRESYRTIEPELRGKTVAVCGGLGSAELMGRFRLKTTQRFFDWLMWIDNSAEARKKEMIDSFVAALTDENVTWLISDIPIEKISAKALNRADVAKGLSLYQFFAKGECPYVYVYKNRGGE